MKGLSCRVNFRYTVLTNLADIGRRVAVSGEKVVRALYLLERLQQNKLGFIFKGGTALRIPTSVTKVACFSFFHFAFLPALVWIIRTMLTPLERQSGDRKSTRLNSSH